MCVEYTLFCHVYLCFVASMNFNLTLFGNDFWLVHPFIHLIELFCYSLLLSDVIMLYYK